jgi:hypothetical protein
MRDPLHGGGLYLRGKCDFSEGEITRRDDKNEDNDAGCGTPRRHSS